MKVKREILGEDKYGKQWYVLIEEEDDNAIFYVYPEENRRKDVRMVGNHIMEGSAKKLDDDTVLGVDFLHPDAKSISDFEDKLASLSFSKSVLTIESEKPKEQKGKWENRGIGKLLSKRIEKWAKESGAKKLLGFLSPEDDVNKLTKIYAKWGYEVKIYRKGEDKPKGHNYAVGIVTKLLSD